MATSSQRLLQQSLDSDSGITHSRQPGNIPRVTVSRSMAQIHPAASLDPPPVATSYDSLATMICMGERKMKRTQMARKAPTMSPCLVLQSGSALSLRDKPIFELPIQDRLKLHSCELETWVRLVTPSTVK